MTTGQIPGDRAYPSRLFFQAPRILLQGTDRVLVESRNPNFMYLCEGSDGSPMNLEPSTELSLQLIDAYFLTVDGRFVGYFFRPKSPFVEFANTHIVAFTNGYRRSLSAESNCLLKSDLVYTTEHLSAFSSQAGACMLLRQFNCSSFIEKLEA